MDEEHWHDVINIDLNSVFYACKKVIPVMRQQGGGAIVNTASISGLGGAKTAHTGMMNYVQWAESEKKPEASSIFYWKRQAYWNPTPGSLNHQGS